MNTRNGKNEWIHALAKNSSLRRRVGTQMCNNFLFSRRVRVFTTGKVFSILFTVIFFDDEKYLRWNIIFWIDFFRENHIKNWYTVAANATGSQSINKISFNEPKWKKEVNIWWDVSNIKPISYFLLKKWHNERKNSKLISYCSNASAYLPNTVWVKREFTNIFFFFASIDFPNEKCSTNRGAQYTHIK